jgi:hypothetical protein
MIYIPLEDNAPSEDWCRRAREATDKLKTMNKEERKQFIKNNSRLWAELKKYLLELSFGKCWYSEAREIVSDYDVDHFRPKNVAKNLDGSERDGYWWLAFEWKNYRISGTICNRPHKDENGRLRGKGDFFPLSEKCMPAKGPGDDLEDELIYFLDPTNRDDPLLLTFDETGSPKPTVAEGTWIYKRVEVTIDRLFLDYPPLVDERKKIWTKCNLLINEAQNIMREPESVSKKQRLRDVLKDLRAMASPRAELSATARACLLSSGNGWPKALVPN